MIFGVDPDADLDPDPIFVINLQDANKKLIFKKSFLLITFWRYMYIIFPGQKSKRSHKNSRNQGFLTIFAWW